MYTWKSKRTYRQTDDSVTIEFNTGGQEFVYLPGQYIDLSFDINGEICKRSYSLCSTPGIDPYPAITVKRMGDGIVSNYILDHYDQIKTWHIDGPFGTFYPNDLVMASGAVVLIGGGSGITPLFSQLQFLLKNTTARVLLLNANRSEKDILFRESLEQLGKRFPDRLATWHFISADTTDNKDQKKIAGRMNKLMLKKLLKSELKEQITVASAFVCGPAGLIEMAVDCLQSVGLQSEKIYLEHFTTGKPNKAEIPASLEKKEVLLHHYEQSVLMEVEPGQSILDAALQHNFRIRYSCKNGSCGTCVARRLQGNVHMAQNYALKKEHLDMDLVLLCQSFPLDDDVALETVTAT